MSEPVLRPMLLASGMTIGVILPMFLTGALAVQMRADLGFGAVGLGAAITTTMLVGAVCSLPAARVTERLGTQWGMRLATGGSALAMLGVATLVQDLTGLIVMLVLAGVANALSHPPLVLFLSEVVPRHRQGLAFGVRQAALPASAMLGGLAVPLLALTVGWRWAWITGAAIALGLMSLAPPRVQASAGRRTTGGVSAPLRLGPVVLLAAAMGLGFASHVTLGAFYVASAVSHGIAEGLAGLLLAAGSVISITSRMVIGAMADRREGGHLQFVIGMLLAGAGGYLLLARPALPLLLIGTVLTFGLAWAWIGLFLFAVVRLHPGHAPRVTAILQTGALFGAGVGPLVFGLVVSRAGYPTAWLVAAASTTLTATLMAVAARLVSGTAPEPGPRPTPSEP